MTATGYRRRQRQKNARDPYRARRRALATGPTPSTVRMGPVRTFRMPEGWEPLGTVLREPTLSWRGRGA